MTYQAVRRTPRPGQPSSTRHLGLRRAGGYAGLADAVPVLPPQRLATSATTMPTSARGSGYLPGPPLSHADGKHVVADPLAPPPPGRTSKPPPARSWCTSMLTRLIRPACRWRITRTTARG